MPTQTFNRCCFRRHMGLSLVSIGIAFAVGAPRIATASQPAVVSEALRPLTTVTVERPEDLQQIPGSAWVLVSSMASPTGNAGGLYAVDSRRPGQAVKLFPLDAPIEPVHLTAHGCPAPYADAFAPHGLHVQRRADGSLQALVVNHGGRESIEVFELSFADGKPLMHWKSCVILPPDGWANGVAALAGDDFVISSMFDPRQPYVRQFVRGEPTGYVMRWSPSTGWRKASPVALSGANGIEVSSDFHWLYVSEWARRRLWRLPLDSHAKPSFVTVDFLPDNLRWTPDGKLLLTGQVAAPEVVFGCVQSKNPCPAHFKIELVQPATLAQSVLLDGGDSHFGLGTGAIKIEHTLWIGSAIGHYVSRYALPSTEARVASEGVKH